MFKRWLPMASVLAAVAAVLLLMPQTSYGQLFRRGMNYGGGGMNYGGPGYWGGPYSGYNAPSYYSGPYGWNAPSYSSTGYPEYYGGPGWTAPGYGWSAPESGWTSRRAARRAGPGYAPQSGMGYYASDLSSQDYYGSQMGAPLGQRDRAVVIDVRVPPNAEIWFDDAKTQETGMFRAFISPPLQPGQDYTYHVRARWTENGQPVEKTRDLRVRAGDQQRIDFLVEATPGERPRGTTSTDQERMPRYGTEPNRPGAEQPRPGTEQPRPGTDTERVPQPKDTGTPGSTRENR